MDELISRAVTDEDMFAAEAMRRIGIVRDTFSADLDRLRGLIAGGGSVKDMRVAVLAYDTLCAVERELAVAMQRTDEPEARTQEIENLFGD